MGFGCLEGDAGRCKALLGPDDALLHRCDGHQEEPPDLLGGEPTHDLEGEGDLGFPREHRVAGDEDETQDVVLDGTPDVISRLLEALGHHPMALVEPPPAPPPVDGLALRDGRQPGPGIRRDA